MKKIFFILPAIALIAGGCVSTHDDILGTKSSQVQTRNYQSRSFDTKDRGAVLRGVVATMQDLGFIIDKADEKLGTISGTSFANRSKLTVSVRQSGANKVIVRANASSGLNEITDPKPYQNFFESLSQSLFLDANTID